MGLYCDHYWVTDPDTGDDYCEDCGMWYWWWLENGD